MITTIIEDMDGRMIAKQTYPKEYNFKIEHFKRKRIKSEDNSFLDELDIPLGILEADLEKRDFIVFFLNKELLKFINLNLEDVEGTYLFSSLNFLNELNIKDKLFDSFENDIPLKFKVFHYIEKIMVSSYFYEFFKFKGRLYFRISYSNDLDILNKSKIKTMDNSKVGVGIIQSNRWVYGNQTFLDLYNTDLDHIREVELINRNIIKREFLTKDNLKYIYEDILNRRQFFFQDNIEFNYYGERLYITEIIIPSSFNNQPAIEVIYLNLTDKKRIKKEFNELIKKLEVILKLGKISVCQISDGKLYCSNEIYSILEKPPEKLNPSELNSFKDLIDIIKEFIVEDDINQVYKDISSDNEDNDLKKINISFRIKTSNGNIKRINCNFIVFSENPLSISGYVQDISLMNHI